MRLVPWPRIRASLPPLTKEFNHADGIPLHGRTAALLTVGKIRDEVIPIDGRPAVRPVLTLGGTFDHRVVDGLELGRISVRLREILEDPAKHLGAPGLAPRTAPSSARLS